MQGHRELISLHLPWLLNLGLFSFWILSPRSLSLQACSRRDLLGDRYSITDSLLGPWNWAPLPCNACWNPFHENWFIKKNIYKKKTSACLAKCTPQSIIGHYLMKMIFEQYWMISSSLRGKVKIKVIYINIQMWCNITSSRFSLLMKEAKEKYRSDEVTLTVWEWNPWSIAVHYMNTEMKWSATSVPCFRFYKSAPLTDIIPHICNKVEEENWGFCARCHLSILNKISDTTGGTSWKAALRPWLVPPD